MQSEIVLCGICKTEYELLYDQFENCASQTKCNCARKDKPKYLDEALLKLGELLNEGYFNCTRKFSLKSKTN